MANIFEKKDRNVIPNWRSFIDTAKLGELSSVNSNIAKDSEIILSIDDYIDDWKHNRTIFHAGDLISAALVNNIKNSDVNDAAKFIIENSHISSNLQIQIAERLLKTESNNDFQSNNLLQIQINDKQIINIEFIRKKISSLKTLIIKFPFNPILYVDISRYYSILGQKKKAILSMKTALFIAPLNRFVLRSAVRLFAHYDEFDVAHDLLRKSSLTQFDPWLTSAEIAMATLRERSSRFIKKGLGMINSDNFSPFSITELASSIGTVELINGNTKNSRKLFKASLKSPNDNSLAQLEWVLNKTKLLDVDISTFDVKLNYEALALYSFYEKNIEDALNYSYVWLKDMPFSKRPVMLGSHISSVYLNNHEKAREFLITGLTSHPGDSQIINNLAYSHALENQTENALYYLEKLSSHQEISKTTDICLKATRGLIYFRSGYHDIGRKYYLTAIEEAKSINNSYYTWLAILNYAREEILIKSEHVESIMEAVNIVPDSTEPEILKLKNEVVEKYKRFKS